jgi:hypothetical protein
MAPVHSLRGAAWRAVGRSDGSDDVLYAAPDGRVAVVHLTWTKETIDGWPSTAVYESWAAFADAWAEPEEDVEPVPCPTCGADWAGGEVQPECPCCGGFAMRRPCPVCGGRCGAVWDRAVADSMDEGVAHWVGSCRLSAPEA